MGFQIDVYSRAASILRILRDNFTATYLGTPIKYSQLLRQICKIEAAFEKTNRLIRTP